MFIINLINNLGLKLVNSINRGPNFPTLSPLLYAKPDIYSQQKVSAMSSSIGIVKSRDKGFVLDLILLFTIVDCFLGRFPPRFFTVKLVYFIGFPR